MSGPKKLRAWMRAEGLNQTEAAKRLGFSQSCVSEWLAGKKRPEGDSALKIERRTREAVLCADWYRTAAAE